ncbi:patatin-like phospholipase family protein [Arenimonas caeni]|uniref:Patatin n=1 Tax=Arenimonas caeni TaxID=2058085 RepID=A0A2P6M935_9GAMM|nr:patatin-like phospholipase family protein [Arenimonas caeni]PRH82492.1 patatin [Arenimonas caeni]
MRLFVSTLLVLALAMPVAAEDVPACRAAGGDPERPRIGLVLGGGGARGFAHVAVLRELERLRVPVDCIAGTSMGAIVGGLYASGMDADTIEREMRTLDWSAVFRDRTDRPERSFRRKRDDDLALLSAKPGIGNTGIKLPAGVLSGQRVMLLLERLTQPVGFETDFDRLPIPYRAVATDLNTGQAVVIGEGNLAQAMRASLSIPGVFKPVVVGERVLVDGGLANQLPVDVVRAMGADIVIAVDVGTPLAKLDESAGLLQIIDQISGFMTVGGTEAQVRTLGPADVLVRPALGADVGTADFDKFEQALRIGESGLDPVRPRLAALGLDAATHQAHLAARTAPSPDPPVVHFVRLDNRSRYDDTFLLSRIDIAPGQPFDADRLERNLRAIHGLATLEQVTYELIEDQGRKGVLVTVLPHRHGPNYLETGLSLYSDFQGDFFVNLRAGVLRAPVNPLGGELRGLLQLGDEPSLLLDYYQPLGRKGEWFLSAQGSHESPRFSLFDAGGERLANYRVPNYGLELLLGREYGNFGAATLGLRRHSGEIRLDVGDPAFDGLGWDQGEVELAFTYDRIDSSYLPRKGLQATASVVASRRGFGADTDYEQFNFDLVGAGAIGRHSGFGGLRYHASSDDPVGLPGLFRLGGLTRFAGYRPNERLAENYALAYGGYTWELGRVLGRPALLGGTLEYGRTWGRGQDIDDGEGELHGSLYFGFDSWLGPLQLGYGLREGGEGIFLLELGRPR